MSFNEKIDHWFTVLNIVPKEEGNAILQVLNWDDIERAAFREAKKMYDNQFTDDEVL